MKQLSDNWQKRYSEGDTPWEDIEPWPYLKATVSRFLEGGKTVLDVGCGLGVNTRHLADIGYCAVGVDIADKAIELAKMGDVERTCEFFCADFMEVDVGRFDAVFDRGCLHTFVDANDRRAFAERVSESLNSGGFWINVSGNTENGETASQIEEMKLPRLSLIDIVSSAEGIFEVVEVQRRQYGTTKEMTDFDAFVSVFQKRDRLQPSI